MEDPNCKGATKTSYLVIVFVLAAAVGIIVWGYYTNWWQSGDVLDENVQNNTVKITESKIFDVPEDATKLTLVNVSSLKTEKPSGFAYKFTKNEKNYYKAEATLADPEEGKTYYFWLKNTKGEYKQLGKLEKKDDTYTCYYQTDDDISAYKIALITTEEEVGDTPSTTKLLQATFVK